MLPRTAHVKSEFHRLQLLFVLSGFLFTLWFCFTIFPLDSSANNVSFIRKSGENAPDYVSSNAEVLLKTPIIGIATVPNPFFTENTTSLLFPTIVKWAEMGGAKVVPLILSPDFTEIDRILPNLNGVIFQGGADSTFTEPYQSFHRHIMKYAQQRFKENDPLPIFAVCLGLESVLAYEGLTLDQCNDNGFWRKLKISRFSRMIPNSPFGNAYKTAASKFKTSHFSHHICAHVDNFNKTLGERYEVTASAFDDDKVEFVAAFESISGPPVYGLQFHPEDVTFNWMQGKVMPQNKQFGSSYLAQFFVQECQRRKTSMTNAQLAQVGIHVYSKPYVFHMDGFSS